MRPPESFFAYLETGYSFPSAHAAMSFACYGFIVYLVWRSATSQSFRTIAVLGLSVLIGAIGFSRLYLGVHYLSDVVGGYALGAACVWLAIWTTRILGRRSGIS